MINSKKVSLEETYFVVAMLYDETKKRNGIKAFSFKKYFNLIDINVLHTICNLDPDGWKKQLCEWIKELKACEFAKISNEIRAIQRSYHA